METYQSFSTCNTSGIIAQMSERWPPSLQLGFFQSTESSLFVNVSVYNNPLCLLSLSLPCGFCLFKKKKKLQQQLLLPRKDRSGMVMGAHFRILLSGVARVTFAFLNSRETVQQQILNSEGPLFRQVVILMIFATLPYTKEEHYMDRATTFQNMFHGICCSDCVIRAFI